VTTGGNTVNVEDNFYSPATTTVAVGDTVNWTWKGASQHSVTFDDGTTSATQASGSFVRVFSAAGTYPYHCLVHGVAMSGTITVQ
jgi:plastocyanin